MEDRDEDPITISKFWSSLPFGSHRGKTRNILLSKTPQISGWRQSCHDPLEDRRRVRIAQDQGRKWMEKVPLDGRAEKPRGEQTWQSA